jgi:hypothetical protein
MISAINIDPNVIKEKHRRFPNVSFVPCGAVNPSVGAG